MQFIEHLHGSHFAFLAYALVHTVFLFSRWRWIAQALCEGTQPSSMRLTGFMFANQIIFCEVGHVCLGWRFETVHLLYELVAIGALYGIIKAAQVLALKGVKDPAESTQTPPTS